MTLTQIRVLFVATLALLFSAAIAAPEARAGSTATYDVTFKTLGSSGSTAGVNGASATHASAYVLGDVFLTLNTVTNGSNGTFYQYSVEAASGTVSFIASNGTTVTYHVTGLYSASTSYVYTTSNTIPASSAFYVGSEGLILTTSEGYLISLVQAGPVYLFYVLSSSGSVTYIPLAYFTDGSQGTVEQVLEISAKKVPEPLSLGLLASGLILLGFFARRGLSRG